MKLINQKCVFGMLFFLSEVFSSCAFDVPVHAKITEAALNGGTGFANYLQDNNISSEKQYFGVIQIDPELDFPDIGVTAANLIIDGSQWEDEADVDSGGDRSVNHFYDPITKQGLSVAGLFIGLPSETWATKSNAINTNRYVGGFNQYTWQNARAYESNSIVQNASINRDQQVALMFRSIGQFVHVLEDTAQPQHARNEQHLDQYPWASIDTPWRSTFEDWGTHNIKNITFSPQDLDWMGAGFTCVSNFWDTGLYNPNVSGTTALENNETGGPTIGLAEYCNGNFLTVRGTYGDLLGITPFHSSLGMAVDYFPASTSTDLSQVESNPAGYATSTFLTANSIGTPILIYRCYIDKTNQGVQVSPHSAMDLISALTPSYDQVKNVHADDSDVMSNYYAILIPKAIAYSAGLIDYYFRGRLQITDCTMTNQTCYFTAMNISAQDMTGGVFRMFTDDISSNRTEAPDLSTSYSGTLAPGDSISGSFTVTNCYDPDFTLAYFGPIGVTNGRPLDNVDSNSCASVQFPNPSPCSVSTRLVEVFSDGTNDHYAGMEAWITAYTYSNQPWGTAVGAEFHDGNDTEPYYVSEPDSIWSWWFDGAVYLIMDNGFSSYGGDQYFNGFMNRAQFYLPAPIGYYLIAVAENSTLNPDDYVYGCTYPQQAASEYPMIVDPGLPQWTPPVNGYNTLQYWFYLVGNGNLSAEFPFSQYPNIYDAVTDFGQYPNPSFNPNSVCSSPTNFP